MIVGAVAPAFATATPQPYQTTLSHPTPSPEAQRVYQHLISLRAASTNKMIEGQHLGGVNEIQYPGIYGTMDIDNHTILPDVRLPGLVGTRYDAKDKELDQEILSGPVCTMLNDELIREWKSYQPIIHVTAGARNPWNQAMGRLPDDAINQSIGSLLRNAYATDSAVDQAAWIKFWADIDTIAAALQELKNAHVPVLFRPFAEFNQTNKYYWYKQTAANFTALWADVYNYYTKPVAQGGKGLDNLIFCWEVWALNRNAASAAISAWYPGPSYVDVVAGAYYFNPPETTYVNGGVFTMPAGYDTDVTDFLLSQTRPFGAAQWGLNQGTGVPGNHSFTQAFMTAYPALCFAYYWVHEQSVTETGGWLSFVNDSRVATVEDLPGFYEATFTSVAAEDGWILEGPSETSNVGNTKGTAVLRTGDAVGDLQYKSIVSFNTAALSSAATVTSATLRLKRQTQVGGSGANSPFSSLGSCLVDIVGSAGFGGSTVFAKGDFESNTGVTLGVAQMSDPLADNAWSTGSLTSGLGVISTAGTTQLRVRFSIDDNDNNGDNYINWYSGEAATGSKPELVVRYKGEP